MTGCQKPKMNFVFDTCKVFHNVQHDLKFQKWYNFIQKFQVYMANFASFAKNDKTEIFIIFNFGGSLNETVNPKQ